MINRSMKSSPFVLSLVCLILLLTACDSGLQQDGIDALMPDGTLGIARQTMPNNYQHTVYDDLPVYDSALGAPFQVDVRNMNVEKLDLADRLQDLLHADFTAETVWPA